ncbi:carbon-nitrogen hydrolase family protein [Halocynthiibacter styelae]|uniref:Carbon-nitrogen hydrolase family protein n=1 Tax=Halocynthiibacter styelae TaxID=2761955 RepID=A0A8J7IE08_9RHOB|nr:carbon-nitrogen hydrolase family protein [Paenihalocynthiibacter styelae]MBI1494998.1 carbon-nitrogen hydrolase family protein [Paenihalocynthiibacter styelae]
MSSTDALTLLACQIEIPAMTTASERDAHLATSVAKVRAQLSGAKADLVVLPELSSIDYSRDAFECLDEIAEDVEGASFQAWRVLAQEFSVFISYSFARRDTTGTYISIAVAGPDGELVGHYDKLHMCQYGASMEKEYFDRGDHIFTFKVKGFTLSPIICYDIRIPELCRTLTLQHGVDLILHCGAYFRDESFATWHHFSTTRALENQVFFLSLNRAGANWGNSRFCWPWMDENTYPIRFKGTDEDFHFITISRDQLSKVREDYTFLKDRLEDYSGL